MPHAEFEEKEYEGPLNRELLGQSRHLWTPGLVFEFHFGIDAGLLVSNKNFWQMMGYTKPPVGASLPALKWGYLWKALGAVRTLPSFDLNLFLQIKRPYVVSKPRGVFSNLGFSSPFWRFAITGHQQRALERLSNKIGSAGLVTYGCAAFDTFTELYHYIPANAVVDNSTFIEASFLKGHTHWAYNQPGNIGYACSEPEPFEGKPFLDRIESLAQSAPPPDTPAPKGEPAPIATRNLEHLARLMMETCTEELEQFDLESLTGEERTAEDQGNGRFEFYVDNALLTDFRGEDPLQRAVVAYHDVSLFCHLFDLGWHVVR